MPQIVCVSYLRAKPNQPWVRIPSKVYLDLQDSPKLRPRKGSEVTLAQSWYMIVDGELVPFDPWGDEAAS
jgi:hypothetical protein